MVELVRGLPATREALRAAVGCLADSVWSASHAALGEKLADGTVGAAIAAEAAELLGAVAAAMADTLAAQVERLLPGDPARAFALARVLEHERPELTLKAASAAAAAAQAGGDRAFLPLLAREAPTEAWRVVLADLGRGPGSDALASLEQAMAEASVPAPVAEALAAALGADVSAYDLFAPGLRARGLALTAPTPTPLSALGTTVQLATDVALLFCFDPTAAKAGEIVARCYEPKVLKAALRGRAAVWSTGSDGTYEVELRGAPLPPAEAKQVARSATFALDVVGERLELSGGAESRRVAVPNGTYRATVSALPNRYVIVLDSGPGKPLQGHAEPPHLAP